MNSETSTNGTKATNGAEKGETALARLHAEWVAAGSKRPSKAQAKEQVAAYKKAKADREKLETQIADLRAKESAAAVNIVKLFGKGRFTLDGETFQAASRGEHVFLRLEKPAIEL